MANWVSYLLVLTHILRYCVIIIVCVTCLVKLVRRAFHYLMSLHNQGFNTWIGSVKELARRLRFDIEDTNITNFKLTCKNHVRNSFIENWTQQINDIHTNPIVRTYAISKHSFWFEPYLKQISNTRYRNALTKLRVSSHSLAIERVDI